MWSNAQIAAAGPTMAYLHNGDAPGQTYLTHDDGHTWQRVASPCPTGDLARLTNIAYGNSVWAVCDHVPTSSEPTPASAQLTLARSTDGARHWTTLPSPFPASFTPIVEPASASVLWALSSGGILRSTDGGRTWRTVWTFKQSQGPGLTASYLPGTYPGDLIAQSPRIAIIQLRLVDHDRTSAGDFTNLIRYRTDDGGQTWKAQIVLLASR
jgi:photosystem II stability/assembly factor-like uncharacterized protein